MTGGMAERGVGGGFARLPGFSLAVTVALVAVILGLGILIGIGLRPQPTGPFASCHPSAELAPRVYAGPPPMCIDPNAAYSAVIQTTQGNVTLSFPPQAAPVAVNNFIVLALDGYYNGLPFFNIQSFAVQSGDPTGTGRGGPGYDLPSEPPIANDTWPTGSVGMSLFPDGTVSGGQFFITRAAWPSGPPTISYDHFANVTAGIDVLSQLTASDHIISVTVRKGA